MFSELHSTNETAFCNRDLGILWQRAISSLLPAVPARSWQVALGHGRFRQVGREVRREVRVHRRPLGASRPREALARAVLAATLPPADSAAAAAAAARWFGRFCPPRAGGGSAVTSGGRTREQRAATALTHRSRPTPA